MKYGLENVSLLQILNSLFFLTMSNFDPQRKYLQKTIQTDFQQQEWEIYNSRSGRFTTAGVGDLQQHRRSGRFRCVVSTLLCDVLQLLKNQFYCKQSMSALILSRKYKPGLVYNKIKLFMSTTLTPYLSSHLFYANQYLIK